MNERAYYGHESQLFGVEEYRLAGGKGDGMRLLQVKNGLGLEFTVSRSTATLTRPITMTSRPDGSRTLQRAF